MPFHSIRFLRFHAISFHVIPFLLSVSQSVSVYLSVCLSGQSAILSFIRSSFGRFVRSIIRPSIGSSFIQSLTHCHSFIMYFPHQCISGTSSSLLVHLSGGVAAIRGWRSGVRSSLYFSCSPRPMENIRLGHLLSDLSCGVGV